MIGSRKSQRFPRQRLPRRGIVRVTHGRSGSVICARAKIAGNFLSRLVGLLGQRGLATGEGLWIVPSAGVHTIGMRFPIDVLLLDADLRVVAVHAHVAAGRVIGLGSGADSALELPAGALHVDDLRPGDPLILLPEEASMA